MAIQKFQGSEAYYKSSTVLKSILPSMFGSLKRGNLVNEFERKLEKYFNVKHCYAMSSARLSLYYILKALNLPKDSEILMTPITIADIVNMMACNGLKPKFVEMDKDTINFSMDDLKKKISSKSKVLYITYLYGLVPPNIEELFDLARKNNMLIIEDCSQSIGVTYKGKMVGTLGDYGICSFSSFKTISTLYGGTVLTNKTETVEKIKELCAKELTKPKRKIFFVMIFKILIYRFFMLDFIFSFFTFPVLKVINKIDPTLHYKIQTGNIGVILGIGKVSYFDQIRKELQFYFTDFQAKMGLAALKILDVTNYKLTKHAQSLLENVFVKKYFPKTHKDANMVYWRFPLYIGKIKNIKNILFKHGIETAQNNLPICSEEQCFRQFTERSLENAVDIHNNYLFIPFHGWFSDKKVLKLKKRLIDIFENSKYLNMLT